MNFTLANKGPITVAIDGVAYNVPRFLRRDFVAWAAELDKARADAATAGMAKAERFKFLSVYPVMPVDHHELGRHVFTPAGTERVLRTCLGRAGVPKDKVEAVFAEAEGVQELERLALLLASIVPDDDPPPATTGGDPDPLPNAGDGSNA